MYVSVFMGPVALTPAQDGPLIKQCLELAEQAAHAGFAMVTFGEQHLSGYEPYSNPFLMAARLSAVLGDTWFGTTIVPLPMHPVLRLAEEASVVDLLTGGRLLLGMSAGRVGPGSDFATFGVDEKRRDEAFASKLDLLQRIFTRRIDDPPLVLDTPWDTGQIRGRLMPVPMRAGGPQLAVGTNTTAKIGEVARRGHALFLGPCTAEMAGEKFRHHREALTAAGYSPEHVADVTAKSLVTRHVIVAGTDAEAWANAEQMCGRSPWLDRSVDRRSLREMSAVPAEAVSTDPFPDNVAHVHEWVSAGSPDSVIKQLHRYADLGTQHINTRFTVGTYRPDIVPASFRLFVDEVLPALQPQMFAAPQGDDISPEHRPGVDVLAPPAGGPQARPRMPRIHS